MVRFHYRALVGCRDTLKLFGGKTVGMFDFLAMAYDKSHREDVLRENLPNAVVDTCCPLDSHVWETGVSHKEFNNGIWVIVEQYPDRDAAVIGHKKWVDLVKEDKMDTLRDCGPSGTIGELIGATEYKRTK